MRSAKCEIHKKVFNTSLGWAGVAVSDKGVCRIVLPRREKKTVERELKSAERGAVRQAHGGERSRTMRSAKKRTVAAPLLLTKTVRVLQAYFSGKRVLFGLPVDVRHHTAFRRSVWRAASAIPFGEMRSYGWVAKRIGKPLAARAVGQAMGANPVPVIIP